MEIAVILAALVVAALLWFFIRRTDKQVQPGMSDRPLPLIAVSPDKASVPAEVPAQPEPTGVSLRSVFDQMVEEKRSPPPVSDRATAGEAKVVSAARAVDALVEELEGKLLFSRIAGVSKRNRSGPSRQKLVKDLLPGDELVLVPEPENRHSSNAIRIENEYGEQLGYVPARYAWEIASTLQRGRGCRCFVLDTGVSEGGYWGAQIALIQWNPKDLERPPEERAFEKLVRGIVATQGKYWTWAKLSGITRKNADGVERQAIIAELKPMDQPKARPDTDDYDTASRITLADEKGRHFALLDSQQSREFLEQAKKGLMWGLLVRDVGPRRKGPGLEPRIALILMNEEASKKSKSATATDGDHAGS